MHLGTIIHSDIICKNIDSINNCLTISLLLEKRCIKFILSLFNSSYAVHKRVINGSFHNKSSTISENIRYFMYKYDINMYDWGKLLNTVKRKVYAYDKLHTYVDIQCTANAIVGLCQDRDNQRYDVLASSDVNDILQLLCAN